MYTEKIMLVTTDNWYIELVIYKRLIRCKFCRMAVGTWNVGGISPKEDMNLNHWLTTHALADIYVLGYYCYTCFL